MFAVIFQSFIFLPSETVSTRFLHYGSSALPVTSRRVLHDLSLFLNYLISLTFSFFQILSFQICDPPILMEAWCFLWGFVQYVQDQSEIQKFRGYCETLLYLCWESRYPDRKEINSKIGEMVSRRKTKQKGFSFSLAITRHPTSSEWSKFAMSPETVWSFTHMRSKDCQIPVQVFHMIWDQDFMASLVVSVWELQLLWNRNSWSKRQIPFLFSRPSTYDAHLSSHALILLSQQVSLKKLRFIRDAVNGTISKSLSRYCRTFQKRVKVPFAWNPAGYGSAIYTLNCSAYVLYVFVVAGGLVCNTKASKDASYVLKNCFLGLTECS